MSEFLGQYQKSNIEFRRAEPETIQDLGEQGEHLYKIDSHGFQIVRQHSKMTDWSQKQAIEEQYLPEVERIMAHHLDKFDEVYLFNRRVRLPSTGSQAGQSKGSC